MSKTGNKFNTVIFYTNYAKTAMHVIVLKKNYFLTKRYDFIAVLKAKKRWLIYAKSHLRFPPKKSGLHPQTPLMCC